MAEKTDWEKYKELSDIPEDEITDEQKSELSDLRQSEYERMANMPDDEFGDKQESRFNKLSDEMELPDEYMVYRKSGPQAGMDEKFNIVLPRDRSLSRLMEEHSDSLCWVNCWVYSPVDHWSSQKTKSLEQSKFSKTHKDDSRFSKEKQVGQYHFLTSSEDIQVSHTHNWEHGGMVSGAINSVGSLMAKISSFQSGEAISQQGVKIDKSSTYQDSELPEITVPVSLFTYDNPFRDIIFPITQLIYFTYPMRIKGGAKAEERKDNFIKRMEEKFSEFDLGEKAIKNLKTMFNSYRYVVPHTFAISFSNYTFQLPKCVITDVSITYNGPWTRSKSLGRSRSRGQRTSLMDEIMGSIENIGLEASWDYGTFRANMRTNDDLENPNMRELYEKVKKYTFPNNVYEDSGYPSYAELEITFKSMDPIFAQDIWGTLPDSKVNVTESME